MIKKPSPFSIPKWSIDDQPREKMLAKGAHALTNAELLAILIGSGNTSATCPQIPFPKGITVCSRVV